MFTGRCFGRGSFFFERINCSFSRTILFAHHPCRSSERLDRQSSHCCLGFCHIFSVASVANLKVILIFSAVSTFVLRSRANNLDSARRKRFLSLSLLINSSCTESDIDNKKSNTPFVESLLLDFLARNASSSLLIFSRISALPVSKHACDLSFEKIVQS